MIAPVESEESARGDSPYVGLTAYSERDAEFFFGRSREIELVIANLHASRLTLLIGESGVGKSSILLAGVMHALHAEIAANRDRLASAPVDPDAPEKAPHAVALFRHPWIDPPLPLVMAEIHAAVEAATGRDLAAWTPGDDVVETLRGWTDHVWTILVLLDQFEEYLLYHPNDVGRDTVAGALIAVANDPTLHVNFLLSIREDSVAKLDRFKAELPIFGNVFRIKHLRPADAKDAIKKPLERYSELSGNGGYRAEPALVDEVVRQIPAGAKDAVGGAATAKDGDANAQNAIETPLLQLVMTRLWDEEQRLGSRVLRRETFVERLGGRDEIVKTQLDPSLDRLSEREKDVAADAFRHLVTPSGSKFTQKVSDLASLVGVTAEEIAPILEKLAGGRILRPVSPPPGEDDKRYEIFHDALGPTVLDWRRRHLEQRAREEGEREAKEAARRARRRARLWAAAGILSVLLLLFVAYLARDAREQRRIAVNERQVAESRALAARAQASLAVDPHAAIGLGLRALDVKRTDEAERALREAMSQSRLRREVKTGAAILTAAYTPKGGGWTLTGSEGAAHLVNVAGGTHYVLRGHKKGVFAVAFDRSGRRAITGGEDGKAQIWDVRTGRRVATFTRHEEAIAAAALSSTDPVALTASWDSTARIWDASSGRERAILRGHDQALVAAAFGPRGDWVATADYGGGVRLWHRPARGWRTPKQATHILGGKRDAHAGPVNSLAFSLDGRLLVTASEDRSPKIWNVRTGALVTTLKEHPRGVFDADFSADGTSVATVAEKTLRLFDVPTGKEVGAVRASNDWVTTVEFRGDGNLLLTAGADGVARVWDAATRSLLFELRGHTDTISTAAFSAGGRAVFTAGDDQSARIWDATAGREFRGHQEWVHAAAPTPDGRFLLTGAADSSFAKWRLDDSDRRAPKPLWLDFDNVDRQPLNDIAVDPHADRFVTAGDDTYPTLRDPEDGHAIAILEQGRHQHEAEVLRAAFHPRRRNRIVSTDLGGAVIEWAVLRGKGVGLRRFGVGDAESRIAHHDSTFAVAFSPRGDLLVTGGGDRLVRIWDYRTTKLLKTLRGHRGAVTGAAFHPSADVFATTSEDWVVRIWNARTGKKLRRLGGEGGSLVSVAFSPDGRLIGAGSAAGLTYVWEWPSGKLLSVMRMHADLINSVAFTPDNRIITASDDRTAKLYRCTACRPLDELIKRAKRRLGRPVD